MNLPWRPYSPTRLIEKLKGIDWILAGGYALEAFVGEAYRPHDDIDVILQRSNQNAIPCRTTKTLHTNAHYPIKFPLSFL